jgi:hypothetical protein
MPSLIATIVLLSLTHMPLFHLLHFNHNNPDKGCEWGVIGLVIMFFFLQVMHRGHIMSHVINDNLNQAIAYSLLSIAHCISHSHAHILPTAFTGYA